MSENYSSSGGTGYATLVRVFIWVSILGILGAVALFYLVLTAPSM